MTEAESLSNNPEFMFSVIGRIKDPTYTTFIARGFSHVTDYQARDAIISGVRYEIVSGYLAFLYEKSGIEDLIGPASQLHLFKADCLHWWPETLRKKENIHYIEGASYGRQTTHFVGKPKDLLGQLAEFIPEDGRGEDACTDLAAILRCLDPSINFKYRHAFDVPKQVGTAV